MSTEEAVAIIQRYIPEGANKACEVLIETAAQRWREYEGDYRDDITAVVVKVQEIFKAVDEEDAKIEADIATMWDGGGQLESCRKWKDDALSWDVEQDWWQEGS